MGGEPVSDEARSSIRRNVGDRAAADALRESIQSNVTSRAEAHGAQAAMDSLRDELLASIELRATGKTGAPSGFQPASPTISWAKEKDIWLTMYTNATNARTPPPDGQTLMASSA